MSVYSKYVLGARAKIEGVKGLCVTVDQEVLAPDVSMFTVRMDDQSLLEASCNTVRILIPESGILAKDDIKDAWLTGADIALCMPQIQGWARKEVSKISAANGKKFDELVTIAVEAGVRAWHKFNADGGGERARQSKWVKKHPEMEDFHVMGARRMRVRLSMAFRLQRLMIEADDGAAA